MCRIAAWAASSVLVALALAACGGGSSGNGVTSQPANEIVRSALTAVSGAKSVLINGTIDTGGSPVSIDLRVVPGTGGRGQVSEGGRSFRLVVIGSDVYINGSASFWQAHLSPSQVSLLAGKWLRVPATGKFADVARLTDLSALLQTLVTTSATFTKTGTAQTEGQPSVAIRDSSQDGTLYIASTGKPYLLEVRATGSQPGQVTLAQFDKQVTLTPPPHAIDLSSLSTAAAG